MTPEGSVVEVAVIDVNVVDFCCCFIACKICCADCVLDVVRFCVHSFCRSCCMSFGVSSDRSLWRCVSVVCSPCLYFLIQLSLSFCRSFFRSVLRWFGRPVVLPFFRSFFRSCIISFSRAVVLSFVRAFIRSFGLAFFFRSFTSVSLVVHHVVARLAEADEVALGAFLALLVSEFDRGVWRRLG